MILKNILNSKMVWICLIGIITVLIIVLCIPSKTNDTSYAEKEKPEETEETEEEIIFELKGLEEVTIYVGEEYEELGVKALLEDDTDLGNKVLTDGNVDINKVGEYEIDYILTYKNQEKKLTRKVNVIDINIEDINIRINGEEEIYLEVGEEYQELGATASYKNTDLTNEIKINNNINIEQSGNYEISYKVVYGNKEKTITRKVTVLDLDSIFKIDLENLSINVTMDDNYSYIRLPNGTVSSNQVITYVIPGIGNYEFHLFTKNYQEYKKIITVTNEDMESVSPPSESPEPIFNKVTFDSAGGTSINSQNIKWGEKATEPNNPTLSGYKFLGWYLNGNLYNFNQNITSNITLKANWEAVVQELSFRSNSKITSKLLFNKKVTSFLSNAKNVQGFCTDGTYFYIAFLTPRNKSEEGNIPYTLQKTTLIKLNSNGKVLAKVSLGKIGHSNGLAYNPNTKKIVIAPYNKAKEYLYQISANFNKNTKAEKVILKDGNKNFLTNGGNKVIRTAASISYNEKTKEYIVKCTNKTIAVFDNDFKLRRMITTDKSLKSNDNFTEQAIYTDGNYIYSVYNNLKINPHKNYIGIFNYNTGKLVRTIAIPTSELKSKVELEAIVRIGNSFYVNGNNDGKVVLYKLNLLN